MIARRPSRLLLLACSSRKTADPRPRFADEVYDGPAFRTYRRHRERDYLGAPELFVLSARHGLIPGLRRVAPYDQEMTPERAEQLVDAPLEDLERELYHPVPGRRGRRPTPPREDSGPYSEVFVFGGVLYRDVVKAWDGRGVFRGVPVRYARGRGIGEMLHQLALWLDEGAVR